MATRKPSERSFDAESRKPRLTTRRMTRRQPPPEPIENESDFNIESDTDNEVEKQLEMPVKDDTRRQTQSGRQSRSRQEKDTAEQSAVHSQKESQVAEKAISAAPHMIIRSSIYHMRIAPLTYPKVSTYVPSFYMYFFALHAAHSIVHENTYLRYLSPQYLTVASTLYYAILGFLQVLRAEAAAGIITRAEHQALRRFEREFPFESLPIMSPLIMFFQNLGAVKLADPMYTWICPSLPETIGTGPNVNGIFANNDHIMLPNVPALIRFLYEIGTANSVNDITVNRRLVPNSRTAGNTNFFGINLAPNQQNTPVNQRLIYSAGWIEPPEIPDALDIKVIRRIGRWNLPQLTAASDLQSISNFLQFDGNLEWFKPLVNLCTEEAKFFKGSTNMSAIDPTSGLASLVEISQTEQTPPQSLDEMYPFFTPNFSSDLWKFEINTTRGESTSDEVGIGATTQFLVSTFGNLTPDAHATPNPLLDGPYFGIPAQARQVHQIESDKTRSPRTAFEQIIRENLYDETGKQNSTLR